MRDNVEQLQQVIIHGGVQVFEVVPLVLKKIILEKQWQGRVDKDGKPFTSFEAFATHRLWQGLETTIDDLRLFCRKDPATWALVLAEMEPERKHGGLTKEEKESGGDNITSNSKRGTSATYTLKRLKRDRPDLFAKVTAGTMTANAAAKKAGFRKTRTVYLPADPKAAAAKLRELFGEEFLAQVCGCLRQLI